MGTGRLKVGLAGVGHLGKAHARILSQLPGVELVGIADPMIDQARAVAAERNCRAFESHKPLLDSDVDEMQRMIDLNVTALTRLSYAAVPGFVARGRGALINIASIVAVSPETLNGVYGGSKAFVLAFSQSLQHELAGKGVQGQAVLPGATATEFWARGGLPVEHLPAQIVMRAEDLVDAALRGFDRGEAVTLPSLHDVALWNAYEAARRAMAPLLSSNTVAARYQPQH